MVGYLLTMKITKNSWRKIKIPIYLLLKFVNMSFSNVFYKCNDPILSVELTFRVLHCENNNKRYNILL